MRVEETSLDASPYWAGLLGRVSCMLAQVAVLVLAVSLCGMAKSGQHAATGQAPFPRKMVARGIGV